MKIVQLVHKYEEIDGKTVHIVHGETLNTSPLKHRKPVAEKAAESLLALLRLVGQAPKKASVFLYDFQKQIRGESSLYSIATELSGLLKGSRDPENTAWKGNLTRLLAKIGLGDLYDKHGIVPVMI